MCRYEATIHVIFKIEVDKDKSDERTTEERSLALFELLNPEIVDAAFDLQVMALEPVGKKR